MTPGDAALRELLGRSWDEVEADAAAYIARAEAEVVRWAWVGPDADLWADDFAVFVVSDEPAEELRKTVPAALQRRIEHG